MVTKVGKNFRPWKEASTLLLFASTKGRNPTPRRGAGPSTQGTSYANQSLSTKFDYRVLMLQRSPKSKFMPNGVVFPGGIIDEADFSPRWKYVFTLSDVDPDKILSMGDLGMARKQYNPPVYSQERNELGDHLPVEIAFRICALRETFEETGIIIARNTSTIPMLSNSSVGTVFNISETDLQTWRERVYKNANNFIDLFIENGIVPDLWALDEWSNWLTPTKLTDGHGRRYDTMFFTCFLPSIPKTSHCLTEMVSAEWFSPESVLQLYRDKQLWLPPPQVYELLRICQFTNLTNLETFTRIRTAHGIQQWLPVQVNCSDGVIAVLPGDSLYPESPDYIGEEGKRFLDITIQEARNSFPQHHRNELRGRHDCKVVCNVKLNYNHISPITEEQFQTLIKTENSKM